MRAVTRVFLKFVFTLGIACGFSAPTYAQQIFDRYFSVRAAGMGNAYAAIADGVDSLFYNPSGLALNNGVDVTLVKLRAGDDSLQPMNVYNDIKNFNSNASGTLNSLYGQNIWADAGVASGVSLSGFAAAVYDSLNINANLANPALPDFQIDAINDTGAATGFGFMLAPGLRWGVVAKEIERFGGSLDMPVSSIATISSQTIKDQLENYGTGYSLDTGFALTIPTPVKPTFAFVWKDIGTTSFRLTKGLNNLPSDPNDVIGAFSLEIDGPAFKLIPTIEMDYMTDYNYPVASKVNTGVELQLPMISLRAGLHQGYWTLGAGMDFGIFHVDAASYGEELGYYPGQQVDRRYVLELTVDLGFDPGKSSFFGKNDDSRSAGAQGYKERR